MESTITVTVKVMGKPAQVLENFSGGTVGDVLSFLDLTDGKYTVNVGGQPGSVTTSIKDGSYIVLAPSVKGAVTKKPTKPAKKASKKASKKVLKKPAKKK